MTAAMFGVAAVGGYVARRDLSGLGGIFFLTLIGLVVASLIGMLWHFPGKTLITAYVGLLIFVGTDCLRHLAAAP